MCVAATMLEQLQNLTPNELRERFTGLLQDTAISSKFFLKRTIAYRLQEKKRGKLKTKTQEILERSTTKTNQPQKISYDLDQGQKIVKEYRGKKYEVFVTEKIFTYNGEQFNSLSKIAKLITGKHLSGPLFFNLRKRKHG